MIKAYGKYFYKNFFPENHILSAERLATGKENG